jgi:hypothetical protein
MRARLMLVNREVMPPRFAHPPTRDVVVLNESCQEATACAVPSRHAQPYTPPDARYSGNPLNSHRRHLAVTPNITRACAPHFEHGSAFEPALTRTQSER